MSILEGWLREILRCPACHAPLDDVRNDDETIVSYDCSGSCGEGGATRRYPIRDGIPVLLIDDAELVTH